MAESRGVFISYRREEAAAQAGRIYDQICSSLGEHSVFMDVDSIEPGTSFIEAIEQALDKCKVLLAVMGNNWLRLTNERRQRTANNERDYVCVEIETALRRNIRVVPILIDGAKIPDPKELPSSLKELSHRQAVEISHTTFRSDIQRLLETLEDILAQGSVLTSRQNLDEPEGNVTVASRTSWSILYSIQLDRPHTLELKIGVLDSIWLDGQVVVKKLNITFYGITKTYRFKIVDGERLRYAELAVKNFEKVRLIVDNRVLYNTL